ncbi:MULTISPECIES: sulfotransferase [unclassified Coleofasciculus]|uniref:sulfotransferase n=1 Tax=unclassified Coleofasciculus TaxID=2692782 RepID=UPI00187E946A|nr:MULTISPECIES: sulfotransferase [unclassified Coleofasciculus]MBE9125339.1 sulfotransferase [Coleofasciculus sp. LEGE 07081]MBE9148542.1 sulfotransferase [Coleofasciculus sp. LEGE 07092]
MTLPNFLIIGAAKAGTTALHASLEQHPQIYMTPVKEPNFFALEGEKLGFPAGTISEGYLANCKTTLEAYREQFQGVVKEIAIGEASPIYLYHPKAPDRIQHYIPDAKLIAILRNPVERAYSNFLHHIREGFEIHTDFARALQEEENRIRDNWWWGFYYVQGGFYSTQLQRYFDRFDRSQIKIYLYEDLNTHPLKVLRDAFQFLQVDETFIPDTSTRYNVSGIPKNKLFYSFLTNQNFIKEPFKLLVPYKLRKRLVRNLTNRTLAKPQLSSEVRSQLIQVYRNDIFKLQDLIHRDLSTWLE